MQRNFQDAEFRVAQSVRSDASALRAEQRLKGFMKTSQT